METQAITAARLAAIESITREYGAYSRDAAGWGDVIGGILFFATTCLWTPSTYTTAVRTFIALAPLIWITAKEWLQRRYYQSQGRVIEPMSRANRTALIILTGLVGFFTWTIAWGLLQRIPHDASTWMHLRLGLSLLILIALPFLVGTYLRTVNEFLIGIFLFLNAAAAAYVGKSMISSGLVWIPFALVAAVLISRGLKQHARYKKLRQQMASFREQP